ncbi:Methyl-accepting chemotaxis protein [Candidatus Terasakiella magnetica]|nr:Methyl-accepting chemotaxis protein [Candidatus Terasakiella magnetica]
MPQDAVAVDELAPGFRNPWTIRRAFNRLADVWRTGAVPLVGDLPIAYRFILLVGLAVLAAVSVGGVYSVAERRIEAVLISQEHYRRLNDMAGDVRAHAALMQNLQEVFVRDRDQGAAEAFRREAAGVRGDLERLALQSAGGPMANAAAQAQVTVEAIISGFDALMRETERLGLSDSRGLRGRLGASTKAMESELSMWQDAGALPAAMLRMRLAEKDFMLYGDEAFLGKHHAGANQFDLALDSSPLPKSTREDFRKLLAVYSGDMRAFAAGMLTVKALVSEQRTAFQTLQPALQQVLGYAREGMVDAISQQTEERRLTGRMVALTGLLAIGLFLAICLILARSVIMPIRSIQHTMEGLAHGDRSVAVPGTQRRDEIGEMARAVAVFKETAIAMVRLQEEQHCVRAEAEALNRTRMLSLANGFEQTVKSVADLVARNSIGIYDTARRMAERSDSGESSSLSVVEAAEQCRGTVENVAAATGELTASVREITISADTAQRIVREAVGQLEQTTRRIHGLSDVAGRIGRVVSLIGEIAGRTNMLALNAAIEAQRAGEAGKGFAVVAGEVKTLAQQTALSTREIGEQVAAIQGATADSVQAIDQIGAAILRMDDVAGRVSAAVARQAMATRRIEDGVQNVLADTKVVSEGVVRVTQSAARYCGAAIGVMWAADDLAGPCVTLDQEVDGFLVTVRGG